LGHGRPTVLSPGKRSFDILSEANATLKEEKETLRDEQKKSHGKARIIYVASR
jgi:hypothetical protein